MSMEAYALCPRPLASVAEWQTGLDALGFDLQLRGGAIPPASSGHLPAERRGRASGFECSIMPLSELKDTYPGTDFAGSWPCVYAFCFGTIAESIGALMAIAACAKVVGGLAYYADDGRLMTADQAVQYARETVPAAEELERQLGPGPE
ncbi:hypothetical protein CIW48_13920 [Methylobacterium sp. P1-11]|uniref:hypothetical protein n=1 Tax=Methylobacterium sp. P1-11 TaxID=2024616 RepID=UPI0011EFECD4|nr:hypothetical protein [Methylobacterium sp. P1-11]KAA0123208.1 hypothetical protein CIW48_13920 [Methylobacterium sp. P1-11]